MECGGNLHLLMNKYENEHKSVNRNHVIMVIVDI